MTWDFELIDGPYGGTTEGPGLGRQRACCSPTFRAAVS